MMKMPLICFKHRQKVVRVENLGRIILEVNWLLSTLEAENMSMVSKLLLPKETTNGTVVKVVSITQSILRVSVLTVHILDQVRILMPFSSLVTSNLTWEDGIQDSKEVLVVLHMMLLGKVVSRVSMEDQDPSLIALGLFIDLHTLAIN